MKRVICLLLLSTLFTGCGESEKTRRQRQIELAKQLADIEVQKARELEKIRREREDEDRRRRDDEQRRIVAAQAAQVTQLRDEKIKLVKELTFTTRISELGKLLLEEKDEKEFVLRIRNQNPQSVDIYLKCYTVGREHSKTLFVSVPALETKEIGILEGWSFRSGEQFEVVYNEQILHRINVR